MPCRGINVKSRKLVNKHEKVICKCAKRGQTS
nr:MAG TPA_asm: hypothetical protein [Caudoviricetes sp.]